MSLTRSNPPARNRNLDRREIEAAVLKRAIARAVGGVRTVIVDEIAARLRLEIDGELALEPLRRGLDINCWRKDDFVCVRLAQPGVRAKGREGYYATCDDRGGNLCLTRFASYNYEIPASDSEPLPDFTFTVDVAGMDEFKFATLPAAPGKTTPLHISGGYSKVGDNRTEAMQEFARDWLACCPVPAQPQRWAFEENGDTRRHYLGAWGNFDLYCFGGDLSNSPTSAVERRDGVTIEHFDGSSWVFRDGKAQEFHGLFAEPQINALAEACRRREVVLQQQGR
jgi:hypothetical protein